MTCSFECWLKSEIEKQQPLMFSFHRINLVIHWVTSVHISGSVSAQLHSFGRVVCARDVTAVVDWCGVVVRSVGRTGGGGGRVGRGVIWFDGLYRVLCESVLVTVERLSTSAVLNHETNAAAHSALPLLILSCSCVRRSVGRAYNTTSIAGSNSSDNIVSTDNTRSPTERATRPGSLTSRRPSWKTSARLWRHLVKTVQVIFLCKAPQPQSPNFNGRFY